MGLALFPHNQRAYEAAVALLNEKGRAAVIHPTGTGKSYVAFRLIAENPTAQTLWLSPSEYIFKTQMEALRQSDPDFPSDHVSFMTYAKLMMMDEAELAELKPATIVLDEFHRCGAERWGDGVERLLRMYPGAKLLGLSATNVRYLDNQRDMAEELFDGCVASEMTLGEAIVRGILPAPTYVTTVYRYQKDLARYQRRVDAAKNRGIRDKNQIILDELRRSLEKAEGLEKVFARYITERSGKYILFCASVEHVREVRRKIPEWFAGVDKQPNVYAVYSEDPENSKAFATFKADESERLKLLLCVNMLNEGVHVKGVSGVILFRPTVSPIIYKQQIGRALTAGVSTVPLILDVVNNVENLFSIGAVQEEMAEAVRFLCQAGRADEIVAERFEVLGELRNCRELFERLQSSLSSTWEQYYYAAGEYAAEHGHLNVPKRYVTPGGLSLGSWMTTQRKVRAGRQPGILTEEQIAKLDRLGMIWENRLEIAWERGYEHAEAYHREYGDLLVPARYVSPDGFRLGSWIMNLRQKRLNGEMSQVLTDERIQRLEALGMQWDVLSLKWEENYLEAVRYYQEHGDLNVPSTYKTEGGFALGAWIRNLRSTRQGETKSRPLTAGQIARLDAIGMRWSNSYDSQWETAYRAAETYYRQNGNLNVPVAYKSPDGVALGKWIRRQRYAGNPEVHNRKLSAERIRRLEAIGMNWIGNRAVKSSE